ncbi:TraB/GumN family protein [Thalassococcus sp. S3]|uniref:TraB/GumN family protein n=1 Tax=Thalassococcus sp. S3 TaxID=2017482 RepID=UPI0013EEC3B5|nr:TraB/GumN family protein [Thalassococcus sp. S3]
MLALAFVLLPVAAFAACAGTDLRTTLSPSERAALDTAVAATPYAEGNHWTARRGDQTIHLIGTMHLNDPRWPDVVPPLANIVRGSDLLLLEMTAEEEQKLQAAIAARPELMFITSGPTLPELMSEEDWTRLRTVMADLGMPGVLVSKTQPWMLSVLLGIPACARMQSEAPLGLDKRLMAVAEDAGIPMQALEPYDTLFQLFRETPQEEQIEFLLTSLAGAELAEDQFATITGTYFDEEPAQAWEMSRILTQRTTDLPDAEIDAIFAEMEEALMTRRNLAWMDEIAKVDAPTITISVGALHFVGETGLPRLLEKQGYVLTRAPFGPVAAD